MNLISIDKLTAESQVLKQNFEKNQHNHPRLCFFFFPAIIFIVQLFCLYALVSSFVWIPQQPNHSLILDLYSSNLKNDLVERQLV